MKSSSFCRLVFFSANLSLRLLNAIPQMNHSLRSRP
ncbi:hypothetical protein VIBHAR_06100 [Vibrio campbellii ATCC BAA-1116]|uniref:Uncharacterized protein n=1 Tax=Vibrio campbellii (strain ATCC BAA-1116) TaxID=2902295 RepID=A7N6R5_VIBC1|nr:hypothetical protein VIBHAR_06100 [Vibrio campbellii ATCC BAA-1116]